MRPAADKCAPSWKVSVRPGSRGMGRLSRELDQANARMAAFARRARIAATAAAAALAGAVVAMTRSTVAAANEIGQLSPGGQCGT